jgi:hypothetical protein
MRETVPESEQDFGQPEGQRVVEDGEGRFRVMDQELLRILKATASRGSLTVNEVLEKAILNEALIVEQVRFGRRWQIRDERNRTADVDFA